MTVSTMLGPEETVRLVLDAADAFDVETVDELLTEDLLLFKVGRIRRRDDLLGAIRQFAGGGGSARHHIEDVVTRVDGNLAVVTFRASAEIEIPGQPLRNPHWLESVVLVRSDRWRIAFYHSSDELDCA